MKVRWDGTSVTCVFSQMSAEPFSLSPTDSLSVRLVQRTSAEEEIQKGEWPPLD